MPYDINSFSLPCTILLHIDYIAQLRLLISIFQRTSLLSSELIYVTLFTFVNTSYTCHSLYNPYLLSLCHSPKWGNRQSFDLVMPLWVRTFLCFALCRATCHIVSDDAKIVMFLWYPNKIWIIFQTLTNPCNMYQNVCLSTLQTYERFRCET